MIENRIETFSEDANLKDYKKICKEFSWENINSEFCWHKTGEVNIGYAAIDSHAENSFLKDQNCLVFSSNHNTIEFTYSEMKILSNQLGNALRKLGIRRESTVFLLLPHIPELYIALVACAKIGAIISLLDTESRKDQIKHHLLDSRGSLIITTKALALNIPDDALPDLNHIILIDGNHLDTEGKNVSLKPIM